jgi:hypothetical protein
MVVKIQGTMYEVVFKKPRRGKTIVTKKRTSREQIVPGWFVDTPDADGLKTFFIS